MPPTFLLALLGLFAIAEGPVVRSVSIAVCTKKAVPVTDLVPGEVAVREAGKPRKVLGVELDRRPLEVAIVVDSSESVASYYRSDLVPAVVDFWRSLPQGTKVAVWSTAPGKVAEFGADLRSAEQKLGRIAVAGGNYAFDSLKDACRELGQRGAPRRAVLYVGAVYIQASPALTSDLISAMGEIRATPMIVLVLASARGSFARGPRNDSVYAWDVQGYFEKMTKAYRGQYVEALSTQAVAQRLRQYAAEINGQYRVRFESEPGPVGEVKVELNRADATVRIGRTATELAVLDEDDEEEEPEPR
jgi:hypothetical protein